MQQDNSRLETLQLVQTGPVNGQGLDPLTPVDSNKPLRKTLAIVIFLLSFLTILFDNYHKIDAASFIASVSNPYFNSHPTSHSECRSFFRNVFDKYRLALCGHTL